jgi:hypothetical protein
MHYRDSYYMSSTLPRLEQWLLHPKERFLAWKEKRRRGKAVFCLRVEDVETVAQEELSRFLTSQEFQLVIEFLPDHVNWYDAISSAIEKTQDKLHK